MASKVKIDLDPQGPVTFERKVPIPTPDGKKLEITFTFLHRTREEMAEFQDEFADKAREQLRKMQEQSLREKEALEKAQESGQVYLPEARPMKADVSQSIADDVAAVMRMATGWNADAEWSEENLTKFFRRYAKAAAAIGNDYRVSMVEGRLGN